jgi:hypothetical protein
MRARRCRSERSDQRMPLAYAKCGADPRYCSGGGYVTTWSDNLTSVHNSKTFEEFTFHALLTGDGVRRVELARA